MRFIRTKGGSVMKVLVERIPVRRRLRAALRMRQLGMAACEIARVLEAERGRRFVRERLAA